MGLTMRGVKERDICGGTAAADELIGRDLHGPEKVVPMNHLGFETGLIV